MGLSYWYICIFLYRYIQTQQPLSYHSYRVTPSQNSLSRGFCFQIRTINVYHRRDIVVSSNIHPPSLDLSWIMLCTRLCILLLDANTNVKQYLDHPEPSYNVVDSLKNRLLLLSSTWQKSGWKNSSVTMNLISQNWSTSISISTSKTTAFGVSMRRYYVSKWTLTRNTKTTSGYDHTSFWHHFRLRLPAIS